MKRSYEEAMDDDNIKNNENSNEEDGTGCIDSGLAPPPAKRTRKSTDDSTDKMNVGNNANNGNNGNNDKSSNISDYNSTSDSDALIQTLNSISMSLSSNENVLTEESKKWLKDNNIDSGNNSNISETSKSGNNSIDSDKKNNNNDNSENTTFKTDSDYESITDLLNQSTKYASLNSISNPSHTTMKSQASMTSDSKDSKNRNDTNDTSNSNNTKDTGDRKDSKNNRNNSKNKKNAKKRVLTTEEITEMFLTKAEEAIADKSLVNKLKFFTIGGQINVNHIKKTNNEEKFNQSMDGLADQFLNLCCDSLDSTKLLIKTNQKLSPLQECTEESEKSGDSKDISTDKQESKSNISNDKSMNEKVSSNAKMEGENKGKESMDDKDKNASQSSCRHFGISMEFIKENDMIEQNIIGKGSFGRVYKCGTSIAGLNVAVKHLDNRKKLSNYDEYIKNDLKTEKVKIFENRNQKHISNEIGMSAAQMLCNIPNVVDMLGISVMFDKNGRAEQCWFIQELGNYNVASMINKDNPLPKTLIDQYIVEIMTGAIAIHCLDVINRDMSANNSLFINGHFKICDFGSSMVSDGDAQKLSLTGVGTRGSQDYAIWKVANGDTGIKYNHSVDYFSVACNAHKMAYPIDDAVDGSEESYLFLAQKGVVGCAARAQKKLAQYYKQNGSSIDVKNRETSLSSRFMKESLKFDVLKRPVSQRWMLDKTKDYLKNVNETLATNLQKIIVQFDAVKPNLTILSINDKLKQEIEKMKQSQ